MVTSPAYSLDPGRPADPDQHGPIPLLDYYVLAAPPRDGANTAAPEGILAEEFLLADDHSAIGLASVGWAAADRRWCDSSATSRNMRADALLRSRVVPVTREDAEGLYRDLCGDELPDEAELRALIRDGEPIPMPAPLRLTRAEVTPGFHDTRIYRVLFANELSPSGLVNLRAAWQMTTTGDPADPHLRILATAHRRIGGDAFTWSLRRIGSAGPWCLDVTVDLAGGSDDAVRPVLRYLTTTMRMQGLLPVTVDRFC